MSTLKQFIRAVRSAKTLNDERTVVQKESAAIRASFREESGDSNIRRNNVAKLLYLFTLGERTHFGQIECLKLLASPRFADKRLGYLGTMLLLDENQEVLTLVTNSLKNDLEHPNQYVVGLALCTLGNIASQEMARDLFQEIESLLSTANPYIRRKAALCAMRIIRKVPDLQEHFVEKTKLLLQERNHGVLLCGITLVIDICIHDRNLVDEFRQFTPTLARQLKSLASSGYAPEHDVTGITDPFLQVKILRLLRVLGKGDIRISEQVNDILTQVATNTDSSKNVGNSILYEAVLTILDMEADSGLRVLGVNILGKFLTNKDNNIRYVALNTLVKVVAVEPNAVQRHRNTILDCLRDPDISIRRRALDLSFTLIDESNIRVLVRELLAFLEVANNEFKLVMTSEICIAADRFAPSKRWHIDTVLRVLKLAGNYVREQILSSFIRLIATTPEMQTYCVQKLYAALRSDITQEGLTLAGAWVLGEYGRNLLEGGQYEEEELVVRVMDSDLVDLLSTILESAYATTAINEYIINALMKLTTRLTDQSQIERIRRIMQYHTDSLDVEIQQRSVEYKNLFAYDEIRRGVLEDMPAPQIREESRVLGEAPPKPLNAVSRRTKRSSTQDPLYDQLIDDGYTKTNTSANESRGSALDVIELIGGLHDIAEPPITTSTAVAATPYSSIMGMFDNVPSGNQIPRLSLSEVNAPSHPTTGLIPAQGSGHPIMACYAKNGLEITLQLQRVDGIVNIIARFKNMELTQSILFVNLQAAVPKTQKLQLQPISNSDISPGGEATQIMRVLGSKGPPLRLRIKISYARNMTGQVTDQVDWTEINHETK